jgi:hypothetical protein
MRKIFVGIAAAAFVAAMSAPAFAKAETVKGELVDQSCYMKDQKNVGAAHQACAVKCAKAGKQVALLTSDGKLYEVKGELAADNNAKLVAHMAHTVELTGEVSEEGGAMVINATSLSMAK